MATGIVAVGMELSRPRRHRRHPAGRLRRGLAGACDRVPLSPVRAHERAVARTSQIGALTAVACTLVASKALGEPSMGTYFADWWVWVGLGVWAIVSVGLVRRIRWVSRGSSDPTA
jgi:hypothetical protein